MNDDGALEDFRDSVRTMARKTFMTSYLDRARGGAYPRHTLRTLGANGLLGLCIPQALGGQGAGLHALAVALEEVSYADTACGYQIFANNVAADLIAHVASDEVRQRWLTPIIEGDAVPAIALTEPGTGSDSRALTTRAVKVDDGWLLSGEKTSITQAPEADLSIIVARETHTNKISAYVVPTDSPGLFRQRFEDPGLKALGRGSIAMDDVFVPDSHQLGAGGDGFHIIMREFDLTRTMIAFLVVGIAQRAIDMTIEHVKTRTTFGKTLSRYQGVTFPLAEHLTYLAAIRALATATMHAREEGRPHTVEAAMLKWWAPQVAFRAVQDCVVLHGHIGWSEEMPLQALLRDVSGYQIGDGTPQIQKLIIARHAIGPEVMDR